MLISSTAFNHFLMNSTPTKPQNSFRPYTFGRPNLYILLVALTFIVIGYILMSGGESPDGVSFNQEVFSVRRISVAPIVLTLGYLGVLVAIFYKPRNHKKA